MPASPLSLTEFLNKSDLQSASELHGICTALLSQSSQSSQQPSQPSEKESDQWLQTLTTHCFNHPLEEAEQSFLKKFGKLITESLNHADLKFTLPQEIESLNEDTELVTRITHINDWIDGYLYGYSLNQINISQQETKEVTEWINDLGTVLRNNQRINLGELSQSADQPNEQNECDLMEIIEFIKVGVHLIYQIRQQPAG